MGSDSKIHLRVLGSGTSMGVPSLGCHCAVCESSDPRDKRLRVSLLLSRDEKHVVIDTTPDFRAQALSARLDRLDAVVLTHGHADHILGFDDVRPYNIRQKAPMPVYGNQETFRILRRVFSYAFDDKPKLSTVPSVILHEVQGPFELLGIPFIPIPLMHGEMEVLGYRFGRAAYMTDFSAIPESSLGLLEDLDDLILDALRDVPHPMHQTVEQALALVNRIKPKRAWFTHIAHDLPHEATNERLRKSGHAHVQLAHDGLQFDVDPKSVATERIVKSFHLPPRPLIGQLISCASAADWMARFGANGRGSVIAIGNFDGIHLGHQRILEHTLILAKETGAVATALTFEPPPLKVLRPEIAPLRISTNEQRIQWFGAIGMEAAVVLPFTLELAKYTPEDFVDDILVRQLQVRAVVVGDNFRFGYRQAGDVKFLREMGMRQGFDVVVHQPVIIGGQVVSSTLIRKLILEGNVTRAGRLLGRPFALTGEVVSGTGTGRKFTFPTLNLRAEQELLPSKGVYITRTMLDGETSSHRSVTNVGVRPTFNGSGLTVETHLLGYSGNFSPKRMEVRFWKKLRDEKKFAGAEELRAQIAKDIARANHFFTRLKRSRNGVVAVID